MRFVLIGPTFPFRGGIAHHTAALQRHLSQRHETLLISFKRQYPKWLVSGRDYHDPSRSPLVPTACEYLLDPLEPWTWRRTLKKVLQADPDLTIIQWWVPFWAPCFAYLSGQLRQKKQAVLYLCHNILPHEGHALDRLLAKSALKNGRYFVVQSPGEKKTLERLLPGAHIRLVHLPIYDMFAVGTDRQAARQRLGFGTNDQVMLFFGFVREYKGLDVLLQAMAKLNQPRLHLVVAGEFWEDVNRYRFLMRTLGLQKQVQIENRYIPDEEMGLYFGAADVLVAPYRKTSQSAVVQLAFGFGCPVISTQVGGMAEVIQQGVNGLLVPPDHPIALAEAIDRFFAEGLRDQLAQGVLANKGRFGWDTLVAAIETCALEERPG